MAIAPEAFDFICDLRSFPALRFYGVKAGRGAEVQSPLSAFAEVASMTVGVWFGEVEIDPKAHQ
jgi:hypothetical protein